MRMRPIYISGSSIKTLGQFMRNLVGLVIPLVAIVLSGCGGIKPVGDLPHAAEHITTDIKDNPNMQVDLVRALVQDETQLATIKDLSQAYRTFYNSGASDELKRKRNRIQDQLIGASRLSCAEFKNLINKAQTNTNLLAGVLTTALGAAGAIVSGTSSQALAGAAGFVSGSRAEYNATEFRQKVVETLTKAIEAQRNDDLNIIRNAQARDIDQYTIESAVADAIRFNDHCSLVSAFEKVNDSVASLDDPGIKRLAKFLKGTSLDTGNFHNIIANVGEGDGGSSGVGIVTGSNSPNTIIETSGPQNIALLLTLQSQVKAYPDKKKEEVAELVKSHPKIDLSGATNHLKNPWDTISSGDKKGIAAVDVIVDSLKKDYTDAVKDLKSDTPDDDKKIIAAKIGVVIANVNQLKDKIDTWENMVNDEIQKAIKAATATPDNSK